MTLFHYEGFETIGTTSSTGAQLETRYNKYPLSLFQETSGGHTGDIALIDDYLTEGLALQMPPAQTSRGTFLRSEWPASFRATTNSSHPVMVNGFRYFNYASSPAAQRTVWGYMTGSTAAVASLSVAANDVDLIWTDAAGSATISSVLTADTWHFIEIEWKPTTSANGGFTKVYVDGTNVYDSGSRSIVSLTFSVSFGTRIGVIGTANESGGGRGAYDDWYQLSLDGVNHTTPLGDVRVKLLTPTSDDTPNDWSRSTGADNYALVDGTNWDETSYVEADVTGEDDHYGLETLTGVDTVHALQIDVVCQATDGTPTLHVGFDDGTASEQSGGVIGTASTSVVRKLFTLDPSGSAWTETSVNDVEATQRMTE